MNKKVTEYANEIFDEFINDVIVLPLKVKGRWNQVFIDLDLAETRGEAYTAVCEMFQIGAQEFRDDDRYNKFREMQHELYDLVESAADGDWYE